MNTRENKMGIVWGNSVYTDAGESNLVQGVNCIIFVYDRNFTLNNSIVSRDNIYSSERSRNLFCLESVNCNQ